MVKSCLIAFACSISLSAYAIAETPKQVDVPAGDLGTALQLISRQAGVELVFRADQVKGLRTEGVSGILSAQEAVRKLLEGTPLQLRTDDATGAMMIGPTPAPAAPVGRGSTTSDSSSAWSRFRLAQAEKEERSAEEDEPVSRADARRPRRDSRDGNAHPRCRQSHRTAHRHGSGVHRFHRPHDARAAHRVPAAELRAREPERHRRRDEREQFRHPAGFEHQFARHGRGHDADARQRQAHGTGLRRLRGQHRGIAPVRDRTCGSADGRRLGALRLGCRRRCGELRVPQGFRGRRNPRALRACGQR